jgi:hypothetical protein
LRGRAAILTACPLLLLAACGRSGTTVSTLTAPAAPAEMRTLVYPAAGVSFQAPRNWDALAERPPLVAAVRSNSAVVAVWRYPHRRPLPASRRELMRARDQLLTLLRARSSTVRVDGASMSEVDGFHAIAVDSVQRIAGAANRVRSTHVFAFGAEIVVDQYAPLDLFASVDHAVFVPLLRSLLIVHAR